MFHQQNQNYGHSRMHHPHCNSVRGLRPPNQQPQMTSTSSSSIMTQSYPGPNILQPQKADPQQMMTNSAKTEQHIGKTHALKIYDQFTPIRFMSDMTE